MTIKEEISASATTHEQGDHEIVDPQRRQQATNMCPQIVELVQPEQGCYAVVLSVYNIWERCEQTNKEAWTRSTPVQKNEAQAAKAT
jgi:hypothetical protein